MKGWSFLVVGLCAGCTPVARQQGIKGISVLMTQVARTVYLETTTNSFDWTRSSNETTFSAGTLSIGQNICIYCGVNCRRYLRLHAISENDVTVVET
jgi:hypothetical protein